MGEQAFIAINWSVVMQLINTFIMFLILRHFLFKPVKEMIDKRQAQIRDSFDEAEKAVASAKAMEKEYEQKLSMAKSEAAQIVRDASRRAESRSDEILAQAKKEAKLVMDKAQNEIVREKQKAMHDIKNDITDIAAMIASKVIQKDVSVEDHENLIQNFIDNVGDGSWQN